MNMGQNEKKPIPVVFQQPVPEAIWLRGAQQALDIPPEETISQDSLHLLYAFDSSHFEAKLRFTRYALSLFALHRLPIHVTEVSSFPAQILTTSYAYT
jgi:hypothetical protein